MQETLGFDPGQEDPLEEEMVTHFSILVRKIPWTEEPSGLQPMVPQRVGHKWWTEHARTKFFFTEFSEISFGLFVWQLGSIYLLVGSERKWKPKYNFQLLYLKETFWVIVIPFCILTCVVIFIYGSKKQKSWQTSAVIKIELE